MNQDTAHHMTTMMDDHNSVDIVPSMDNVEEAYETAVRYDEVFPALESQAISDSKEAGQLGQWNQRMKTKSSIITRVFRVPVEERRFHDMSNTRFGEQGEQAKICAEIIRDTSADIEISSSKDQSLTIVVTGKEEAVANARREIIAKLQTQASTTISIPKEHHRFILGKNVKKLQDLEKNTATRIHFPQSEENSDLVKITGSKDGIERARHELQLISDEQAKQDRAVLNIPKCFHPFISGPFGRIEEELAKETGARINIPPLIVQKDEIVVSGEKEAVAQARERIMAIFEEKKRKSTTVSVEVSKSKHRYVIGPKGHTIHEILEKTGVYAEIPPAESPIETITLRGDQDKLGTAITMLYNKANSGKTVEVNAPSWIHKYIIGKQGATIKQITQDLPKVHVKFTDGQNKIEVEGPTEEVDQACALLEEKTKELLEKFSFVELNVDPKYHRFIIGKNGANVNKLKTELGVQINIPVDSETIRIVGSPENAEQAKLELMEMVARMENEVTKEVIIEQRFHRTIIGTKGEKIKEIRDRCNQVNITFPEQGVKSDKVVVRGPKQDVDMCVKLLSQMNKDLIAVNFKAEVPIYKQLHKYVIGKGGANIRKIRDETDTKIDLPAEGTDSDVIVITGKKENVLAAKEKIIAIQNSLDNIVSVDIIIPARFYNTIIGTKGRLIRSIKEDCGGVTIQFPAEGSGSDKVSIRGPKEDVDKAKKILVELSNEKQQSGFTEEVKAKKEHHKFLIGKNGANIKKIRDKTGARIIFPSDQEDTDVIQIIGHKDAVQQAKKELSEIIGELDKVTEIEMNVDPRFHRHFVARRGEVLRQISEDYGGVTVSFPRSGVDSDKVILKGEKKCVEAAKVRIQEIVTDLESRVTIECVIPQKHHRTIMGQRGYNVQNIQQEHQVHIKFPDREIRMENGDEPVVNGEEETTGEPKKSDIITITGQDKNCEAAKQALLALVPTTLEVPVAYDLHRYIIGGKGKGVREMMDTYQVNITIPPAQEECDLIKITGPPQYVEEAKAALLEKVAKLEEERQDRELRSFKLTVEVDPKYHTKIIGRRGAVVSEIRKNHDVQIQFPERVDANENVITIIGYESKTIAARDEILKIVKDLEDLHEVEVTIDHRVHSRLIGTRGRNIRRIMDDFSVEIKFPRNTDPDPDMVVVSGSDENVDEAVDYLKNLEEEYLQDMAENTRVSSRYNNQEDNDSNQQQAKGFVVTGGPWEQKPPDTTSAEEFPSFGAAETPRATAVWGPRH